MAITPSQWSHVLTIPESYTPSAATSGQTLVITESVIAKLSAGDQATFWSNVQNGGGDVRICESSDGTNQLPVEVVSLDNSAQTCVIWTRKPTYSGAGNLYVFIGKVGETQPSVTDPFGRNAVWQDYEVAAHLNEAPSAASENYLNSTGGAGGTAPASASASVPSVNSGQALKLDGSNEYLIFPVSGLSTSIAYYGWAKCDSLSIDQRLMSLYNSEVSPPLNSEFSSLLWMDAGGAGDGWAGFVRDTENNTYVTSTDVNNATTSWQHIAIVYNESIARVYVNGSLASSVALSGDSTSPYVNELRIGRNWDLTGSSNFFDGAISDVRMVSGAFDANKLNVEYNNQSNPASFYGTPTLASTGAGTATADVTETSDSATESSSISITANITAQITETFADAIESSTTTITTLVTASVTELSQDAAESSAVTLTNNLVTLNVTEIAQDFTESVSATVAGKVSALVTETSADASESSTLSISANISAAVTEIAQDFADDIGVNVVGSFTVEVTETTTDFDEACYIQLPVQRLVARKTISVNSRRSSTIRVTRRNHVIRVK